MPAAPRTPIALAIASLLLAGCAFVPLVPLIPTGPVAPVDPIGSAEEPQFEFVYRASTGEGFMDQVLDISNPGDRSYAPILGLEAVDETGAVLDVTVTTVFGSNRGYVVVPARGFATDILRFNGAEVDRIADVWATVFSAVEVKFPTAPVEPVVTPLDSSGAEVTRNDVFTRVRVGNDNDDPVAVRLVYVVWDVPGTGRTQQAEFTVPLGGLVTVPARGETEVAIDPGDAAVIEQRAGTAPASIKAYFST